MDFAFCRVCLSASGVAISGFAAPARTPTPMPARAISTRDSEAIFPSLINSSMPLVVRIATSNWPSLAISCSSSVVEPYCMAKGCPAARSHCGLTLSITSLIPLEARTRIPGACPLAACANNTMNPAVAHGTATRILMADSITPRLLDAVNARRCQGDTIAPMSRLLAAIVLMGASLHAQWINIQTPGIPRTAEGKPDLAAPAPKTPDGKPDLSGTWDADRSYLVNIAKDLKDVPM